MGEEQEKALTCPEATSNERAKRNAWAGEKRRATACPAALRTNGGRRKKEISNDVWLCKGDRDRPE